MAAADLSNQRMTRPTCRGASSGAHSPLSHMGDDPEHPDLRTRIRWGNVAKAAAVVGLVAVVVAWPRLSSDAPALPDEDAAAPRVDLTPPAPPPAADPPPAVKERPAGKKTT